MTWLPIEVSALAERDAVLGLRGEIYEGMRALLAVTWRMTDPRILDLCRLRLAQMMDTRAELDGADEACLAALANWESSPAYSERERAALAYTEQYHFDHRGLTSEQKAELGRHFSFRETVNFVWAIHINDVYIRVLTLLDIDPDDPSSPIRVERTAERDHTAAGIETRPDESRVESREVHPETLIDPEFASVRAGVGPLIYRQGLIDEVTHEAARLHNSSYQGCRY